MKTIKQWQAEFARAAALRFPQNKLWSEQDRVLSIMRQLADVGGAIQKEKGILGSRDHAHTNPRHRIAALVADILILCEDKQIDLEQELPSVLDWFQTKPTQ